MDEIEVGTTSIQNPIFFIELDGVMYGGTINFQYGSSSRTVTVSVDAFGNIVLHSIVNAVSSVPELVIDNLKVHIFDRFN